MLTEEQVDGQNKIKNLLREGEKPQSKYHIDMPLELRETKDGEVESLPETSKMGDTIMIRFHFARIRDQSVGYLR